MVVEQILEFHTEAEIRQAINTCQSTFKSGHTRPVEFRRRQLQQLWLLLDDNKDALAQAVYNDLRKARSEFMLGEIVTTLEDINHALENLDKWTKDEYTTPSFINRVGTTCHLRKEPKGAALIISPWNYPVFLCFAPLAGAIAAGCTAIVKPSELSPHSSKLMTELIPKYLDNSAYLVVNGAVTETSLLLEAKWNHIFYTGNGNVAKIIMKAATKDLTSLTLELGGKSPCIIDENCNLAVAAKRVAFGKAFNSGQTCIAPDYVLITEKAEEQFIAELKKSFLELYGENPQNSPDYARMINNRHFHRAMNLLNGSKSGTRVLDGKSDEADLFIPPIVIANCARNDKLMEEELFAPFLPMIRVRDVDDAIEFINSHDDPLVLYIFSTDKKFCNKVMDQTQSGGVLINDTLMHVGETSLPFGGIGPSGMGAYHGKASFDCFTHVRSTMTKGLNPTLEKIMAVRYAPYSEQKLKMGVRVMQTVPRFKKGFIAKYFPWLSMSLIVGVVGLMVLL
ncbi:hypothetical protein EMPS_10728 [Entomortierella parvispora]|uniref:Aldehyde dehydrogenase n=1 Tax=Entomortierella parvispora TaxID=205924 RepID=A0A9P3M1G5_9FUNG|nr:hypothetical protein EMPS_10728 [Entomortierella parvispora]